MTSLSQHLLESFKTVHVKSLGLGVHKDREYDVLVPDPGQKFKYKNKSFICIATFDNSDLKSEKTLKNLKSKIGPNPKFVEELFAWAWDKNDVKYFVYAMEQTIYSLSTFVYIIFKDLSNGEIHIEAPEFMGTDMIKPY